MTGQISRRANISNISNALPCEVTTSAAHGYSTHDFVRLTDLNGSMPVPRGEDPLNNYKFRIIVTSTTTFTLQDPITHDPIDSLLYTPYVEGGYCNLVEDTFYYHGEE